MLCVYEFKFNPMFICSERMLMVYCTILAYVFSIKHDTVAFFKSAQIMFVISSDVNFSL